MILVVVQVSPIAVMQAASMAFMVSKAVTVRRISCIKTVVALLRAAPSFRLHCLFFVELHGNSINITSWASSAQVCFFRTYSILTLKTLWVAYTCDNAAAAEANTGAGTGDKDDRQQGVCGVFRHSGD